MSDCEKFKIKSSDTTLDVTIVAEKVPANTGSTGAYYKLRYAKGDKCIVRYDLICKDSYSCDTSEINNSETCNTSSESYVYSNKTEKNCKPLATFIHLTDIHIIDAPNPSRATFLAAFIDDYNILSGAFRPYEIFTTQIFETMIRRIHAIKRGPHLKQKFQFAANTGDTSDSMIYSEISNQLNLVGGGKVIPNVAGDGKYVGVQDNVSAPGYFFYYHFDSPPPGESPDIYKVSFGYPNFPGILKSAVKPFQATGLKNIQYYVASGNHDVTKIGGYSPFFYKIFELFNQLAIGDLPDLGSKLIQYMTPVQAQLFLKAMLLQDAEGMLDVINNSVLREVPRSLRSSQFTVADFISAHFNSETTPKGCGFTKYNIENNVLYYTFQISDCITGLVLDTCNINANVEDFNLAANGSIGTIQLNYIENELRKRHSSYYNNLGQLVRTDNKDELIILFGHHTIETMNNIATVATTVDNDPQKINGDQFVQVIHRYPNIIAYFCGHTHSNNIKPYPDPSGKTQGFWQINTASHIDFPQQSRIAEIGENKDGTLSIFVTLFDHLSPADVHRGCFETGPAKNCCGRSKKCETESYKDKSRFETDSYKDKSESCETESKCETKYNTEESCSNNTECEEEYSISEMASISRELSYSDPYIVDQFSRAENRTGTVLDRNVELLIPNPLWRNLPRK